MDFPLEKLPDAIAARADTWTRAALVWQTRPVSPNHGTATIISDFESEAWMGTVIIWATGETEFQSIRLADDRIINKHYDLCGPEDLDRMMTEIATLIADNHIPPGAIEADWVPQGQPNS
ncbi:hypothetical protein [Paractinoplanes lichenicola]|uniref:Uncharacterized protein n=1 Tax=Paractinoplanes lichenicola TaxID=2802976 RepID=A0ABS1W353_9ACTN|nr:hypothetical protein [Actinoplanes lichenicola]MBL7261167.1 hypothetical protein [Actinoplanes lichenicola]